MPQPTATLEYAIPFVTFHWRTQFFSIHNRQTTRTRSFKEEIESQLPHDTLPGRTKNAILNMANSIDEFEDKLLSDEAKRELVVDLGLGDIKPKAPFDKNYGILSGQLANAFVRAVIIDRIMWALSINVLDPFTRYINDDFPGQDVKLDMATFEAPIFSIAKSLAVCEDNDIQYSNSLSGDNLRCGVATIKHEGLARFHHVASHLCYTANLILFLGLVGAI